MNRDFLMKLLNTPSVTGCEEANQRHALAYGAPFAHRQFTDAVGNAFSVVNPDAPCRVLLCGHMDEIGFRVTDIDEKGYVRVQKVGGVRPKLYVGAPMQILHETVEDGQAVYHRVPAVGAVLDELLKKEEVKDEDLVLDIGAATRDEAAAVVSVGDPACADSAVQPLMNDRIAARALDDKSGVYIVLEAARRAAAAGTACGVYACTTVGEETTSRGAYFAAARVKPACAVIVDVTHASDAPDGKSAVNGPIALGGGPVLCRGGQVNKAMNRLFEAVAREKGIPLQYEVAGGRTYTDGDTALMTGEGVPVALVSIPLRYMHSSVEVADWRDLEACADLIAGFLCRISSDFDYRPVAGVQH